MKVTVAFGDVKVVVPCGNGDITIRQLSELAITRYQKSLQQETNSPRMSININALVLARDCGILDWDDSVSDVIDDRELIIARFQNKPHIFNNNAHIKSLGPAPNVFSIQSNNNNHYLCSEWKYGFPMTEDVTKFGVVSKTEENLFYSPALIEVDCKEKQEKMHIAKNGSCLLSISPDSIDSPQQIKENTTLDQCPVTVNRENECGQNSSFWNQSAINKANFSMEESDSSQWPAPPPLIVTTSEESTLPNKAIFSNAMMAKNASPLNQNNPYFQNKLLDHISAKKGPLKTMTKFVCKTNNHDTCQTASSLSPSLPSNADAKSVPQSFYSSLESTAVSDNNNSSYDEGTNNDEEKAGSSKSVSINQAEEKNNYESLSKHKSDSESGKMLNESKEIEEPDSDIPDTRDVVNHLIETNECDLSDIPEEDKSTRSPQFKSFFSHPDCKFLDLNSSKISSSLQHQMPPPMPPLRSAFTKLSPHPFGNSLKPVNFLPIKDANSELPIDIMQTSIKPSVVPSKNSELSKSEYSIPSLFESDDRILEYLENEWSVSRKSGDQESTATATTTETSVNTTTTTTTSSYKTFNKSNEKCILNVTLKKSANGFGFSLTSRQNPVDLTNPVYVSKVLENGPAIFDGRMKSGDRIVMINDEDVSQYSQKDIKDILLNIPTNSVVKIGLCRPTSDAISNILDAINTASSSQKKSIKQQVLNHTVEKRENDDCNQICIEEQKPVSFPKCSCDHKSLKSHSKLNLYHFIIPLHQLKSEIFSSQYYTPATPEPNPKTLVKKRSQNSENKIEPPAIPLNHQNKLSPCSFSTKHPSGTKASTATLGISVRRGFSQMLFSDSHDQCLNVTQERSKNFSSTKPSNLDTREPYSANNYAENEIDSIHNFCPNCHGIMSSRNGVFVKSIIPGGSAHMDGRVLVGDEIIAVQGICLYNGEDFLPPINKVLLGDAYDSLKVAQVPWKFQHGNPNTNSPLPDSCDKKDPLSLLKQILSHAQSTCSSVSLTILRRSLEQRSCSINTLASVDTNCCHNVTVAADIHTSHKNDDIKGENFLSFIMPPTLTSVGRPGNTNIHRERMERFDEYHGKDHDQRYYQDDRDNSPEMQTSDLICLYSDHGSDEPSAGIITERNSIPSSSHTYNASIVESYHVSSDILTDVEKVRVPRVSTSMDKDGSVDLVTLRHSILNRQPSHSASFLCLNPNCNHNRHFKNEFDLFYFNRNDSSRKSFSLKRKQFKKNKPLNNFRLPVYASKTVSSESTNYTSIQTNTLPRPISVKALNRVIEEDQSDCFAFDHSLYYHCECSNETSDFRAETIVI